MKNNRLIRTILNPAKIRGENLHNSAKKSRTGAPQFPGAGSGLSIQQIRKLISEQPRQAGFTFQVAIGENTIDNLKLPGDSRILLGINWNALTVSASDDTYDFSINNNIVIDNVPVLLNSTVSGSGGIAYVEDPYIPIMQPLNGGSDTFEMTYTAGNPGTVQMVLWYI